MPDFKSLQCFTELVQSKSFSTTADKLCLTQPSVSKIMAALEAEFGVPLLEKHSGRRKRSLEPTEIGRIVYRHALSLLEQRRALYQEIDDYRQVKTGTLRIGIALFGGLAGPNYRLLVVLRHPLTIRVHCPEQGLGIDIALLGRFLHFGNGGIFPVISLQGGAPTSHDDQQCQNLFFHLFSTDL
mgnify:CR=1 FL=1